MEKKYLRIIGIAAVSLTIIMIAYTVIAAVMGSHASNSSPQTGSVNGAAPQQSVVSQVDANLFPPQLAGMTRSEVISGQDGINSVEQLHGGKAIPVSDADVVTYKGNGQDEIIIWYSDANTANDAQAMFKDMDSKMPEQSTMFQNYQSVTVGGRQFKHVTSSDGMNHYYWVTGKRVMWVEIHSANPEAVLQQVAPLY